MGPAAKPPFDWSLLLSVPAFCISVFLLWKDYLQPFRLSVRDAGRITTCPDPWWPTRLCLYVDLIFTNDGARRGVVDDVAIQLRSSDGRLLMRSKGVADRQLNLSTELPPPKLETFASFTLDKHETIVRRVLFVPQDQNAPTYRPQRYDAGIWVHSSDASNWALRCTATFTITAEDIEAMNKSTVTPNPDGGYFIKIAEQHKPTDQVEQSLQALA